MFIFILRQNITFYIFALSRVCLYYIYEYTNLYMCNTLEYIAQLLRAVPPVENCRQFSYCVYFLFLFSLCTYLSQFANIIVGGQEGRQKLMELLLVCSHFDFLFFLRSEKPANFNTIFTRRSRFKKEQNNGKRNAGLPKCVKNVLFLL